MDPQTSPRAEPARLEVPHPGETLVVVVDDDRGSLEEVERFLRRRGYPVRTFEDAGLALAAIEREPPQLLVTGKTIGDMGGIELAEKALETDPSMSVILITSSADLASATSSLRLGVSDYLTKPLSLDELERAVSRAVLEAAQEAYRRAMHVWLREEVERKAEEVERLHLGALTALMRALEARSEYFVGHSQAVAMQAASLARALGLAQQEVEAVRTAGLLHDVGMIGVPDHIVQKREELEVDESGVLRDHCTSGASILEPLDHLAPVVRYVLEHHEHVDGSGYPHALRGAEISLGGSIVGLAEVWTALQEDRPHRPRRSRQDALDTVRALADVWFPAPVVGALLQEHGL
jgi:putative nucleotidyltransferase with HDIG domain